MSSPEESETLLCRKSVDIPVAPAEQQTVVQGAPAMQKQVITQGDRVEEIAQILDVSGDFFHEGLQPYILVHGDDFSTVGRQEVRKHALT